MKTNYHGYNIEDMTALGETLFFVFTPNDQGIGSAPSLEEAKVFVNNYLAEQIESKIVKLKDSQRYEKIEEGGAGVHYTERFYAIEDEISELYDQIDKIHDQHLKGAK